LRVCCVLRRRERRERRGSGHASFPSKLTHGSPVCFAGFDIAISVLKEVAMELERSSGGVAATGSSLSLSSASPLLDRGHLAGPGPDGTASQQPQQQQQGISRPGQPASLPLLVTWICQRSPGPELLDQILQAGLQVVLALYVQPPQARRASLAERLPGEARSAASLLLHFARPQLLCFLSISLSFLCPAGPAAAAVPPSQRTALHLALRGLGHARAGGHGVRPGGREHLERRSHELCKGGGGLPARPARGRAR
jgi:hypothetical protein